MSVSPLRVVVVGREGQVARELARTLTQPEFDVVFVGRPDCDLLKPESARAAIRAARPNIVINAAAYTQVDRAEDDADVAFAINARAPGELASAAAEVGAAIVHFSTDYVFDGSRREPYKETDAPHPLSVYGRTKLEGEQRVAAANARHVILRTAWVCSPFGNNFLKTMLRLANERPELRVVDDQHGCPTFAADLAVVVRRIAPALANANAPAQAFGIFHAVNAGETTWCGFARAIMDGAKVRRHASVPVHAIPTKDYPTKAHRPASSLLATDKLRSVHGISLPTWQASLETCLDQLIGHRS